MSDIQINVAKKRNADSIRKADTIIRDIKLELQKVEGLRPKNCNCDCGYEGDSWPDELINESQK
jgi:hypothetical protein